MKCGGKRQRDTATPLSGKAKKFASLAGDVIARVRSVSEKIGPPFGREAGKGLRLA